MDVLPFEPVELVAVDPARNLHRRWRVAASRDLFGMLLIETDWGRTSTAGQRRTRSFAEEAQALRYVRALLARRGRARQRIGVAYVPTAVTPAA